ncbi:hypothetical protein CVH10_18655, partial [Halomonas sp. ND22Bw]|uniref:hypothetical protein n=1 Tax=Halomonas sp. ND22Bw TaxID=2054178 RepID=UPI000D2CF64E
TVVVLLTRDGKLPVRQLTIGETLDRAEAGMRRAGSFSDGADQVMRNGLAAMRARHAHELNAPAWITHERFSLQDFYNGETVYGRGDKDATYPVYAFDEATYDAARTDAPQWLA